MTPAQKQLELRLTVTADTSPATRALQQLGAVASGTQGAASGARPGGGGYAPPPGYGASPYSAPPPVSNIPRGVMPGYGSPVSAFDRPIPVVIVGPKPLLVSGSGGNGGISGGGIAGGPNLTDRLLGIITKLQLGGVAGTAGQIQGYSEAANEALGMAGMPKTGAAIGRFGAGAAIPAALAAGTVKGVGQVKAIMDDQFTTSEQGWRAGFRQIVPFGESIQSTFDDYSGRKAGMEMVGVRAQQNMATMQARTQRMGLDLSLAPELAGNRERARQLAGASPILEGVSDRTTAVGEQAFRDKQRLLPIQRESAKAEREAAVAAAQQAASADQLLKIEGKMQSLDRERASLQRELLRDENQSGVNRKRVLERLGRNEDELQAVGGMQQQARQSLYAATKATAQSRYNAGMGEVQTLLSDAGSLEEKAERAAGNAQNLGGMNRFSRANAVRSLKLLQQYGPDLVGERDLAAARSIAPQTVGKILEQFGKGTSQYDELREIASADFAGDPDDLRSRAGGKRDEAAAKKMELEKALAESTDAAGKKLGSYLADVINQLRDSIIREVERKMRSAKTDS